MTTEPIEFNPEIATSTLDALKLVHGEDNPERAAFYAAACLLALCKTSDTALELVTVMAANIKSEQEVEE